MPEQIKIIISDDVKEDFKKMMGWSEDDYNRHVKSWVNLLEDD